MPHFLLPILLSVSVSLFFQFPDQPVHFIWRPSFRSGNDDQGPGHRLCIIILLRSITKIWATQNNLRFAYGSSAVVEGVHLVLRRISKWVVSLADGIGKRMGANRSEALSIRELDEAIDIKTDEEASPAEKSIMKGIVKFGNISVKQIMRSRLDVSGIEYDTSFGDLNRKIEELHYSRLPVYKGSLDEITGIINTKDLIAF